jgi:hypothetical protein
MTVQRKTAAFVLIALFMSAPLRAARPMKQIMYAMAADVEALEKPVSDGRWDGDVRRRVEDLTALFQELKGAYRRAYRGSPEDWTRFCDDGLTALDDMTKALEAGDAAGGRAAFARLGQVRDAAHKEFRPGLLGRIRLLFSKP